MGLAIEKDTFTEDDYKAFSQRLYESLAALKVQIRDENFGCGQSKIGAELECYIVDKDGAVLPLNEELIRLSQDSKYTVELNRFNLEINFDPISISPTTFSELEHGMNVDLATINRLAEDFGAHVVPTGILPTLEYSHLQAKYMTNVTRYRLLSKHLHQMRGDDFQINIKGRDQLNITSDHVALEGANASFQFHLMVEPNDFADVFNATQLTTALVLAVSANSPILLDKVLWDETRIALFKQSIDSRSSENTDWRKPARVPFGHGWVREGAWELFAETVALYPPLFPVLSKESPLDAINAGRVPKLEELCLHMGTTWPWNRAVYSCGNAGHVRIEMRALPSGPTVKDMCASAAFASGLAVGLKEGIRDLIALVPFKFAEYNFYRAAQSGLDANIIWPHPKQHQLLETPIVEVLLNMLPVAEKGLNIIGIEKTERDHYLNLIEQRLVKKMTGARWQRWRLDHYQTKRSRADACQRMFIDYLNNQQANLAVSEWQLK